MLTSRRTRISLALCAVSLSLFGLASAAHAGTPATVTVRVEGNAKTVLPPTQVTTTTAPVVKEGHSCPGTSVAGALQLATSGNWSGSWSDQYGFFVETIESESYVNSPFEYWTLWLNNKAATTGICESELEPGESILFFPECFGECPEPPNPLGIEAPAAAEVGKPVLVTVSSYANASGAKSAAEGAAVAYEGAHAVTDSSGHATLTFAHVGEMTVEATGPKSIRTETTICVHNGNDGNCGTQTPSGATTTTTNTTVGTTVETKAQPYVGPYALAANVTGPLDGHTYPRRNAPRILAGTITAHGAVAAVGLELRREYRGRCSAYEGLRERFVKARCGEGSFFKIAGGRSFSYLLPSALAPGRYVLDVRASDAAGNTTTLARGSSRIVFYVR